MSRVVVCLGVVLLVLSQVLIQCEGLRSGGKGNSRGSKDPAQPKTLAGSSPGLPSQNATRRGLGISAWGIVALFVSFIVVAMGCYYFTICYPLCAKRSTNHRYDKMTLPPNLTQPKLGAFKNIHEVDSTNAV